MRILKSRRNVSVAETVEFEGEEGDEVDSGGRRSRYIMKLFLKLMIFSY